MEIIDWIILLIVVAGLVLGYIKGLVSQISTLCGLILGLIACNLWGDWATEVLLKVVPEASSWPAPEYTTSAIACIVLFLIVFLGIKVVGAMFKSAVHSMHLGIVDRALGSFFCVFKYMLLLSIVLNVWYLFDSENEMFGKRHALDNVPFELTMQLAPSLFGVDGSLKSVLERDLGK